MAKFTMGRLRPHFFDVCNLDMTSINCGTENQPIYVTDYKCLGNPGVVKLFGDDLEESVRNAHIRYDFNLTLSEVNLWSTYF